MLNGEVHWWINIFRNLFTALDELGYMLLGAIFDVFFTVANAKILQGDFIVTFYGRVQLILGVFMVFRLSITLLQIIVNPDLAKDKQKGASKILMRIVLSLVMLTLIAPINIPNDDGNPLNQQIAENGILFGFLYQIQNSVVQNNILGKLILGSSVDDISSNNNSLNLSGIGNIGDTLSATVAKMFITPALKDGVSQDDITDDAMYKENLACEDLVNGINYFDSTIPYQTLLTGVRDLRCSGMYAFDYTLLGGAVVSIVMFLIVLGFTVDIAVRAIKLALLRLIAPIPIIAYMDPGQEKNGAFGSWVKTLTSTYLDLFVRLIVIYFGIYIIVSLTQTTTLDLFPSSPNFFTSAFATIFIIIGILVFMKQAPKFFKDMLGIKGDGNFKLFGGLGTIAAAGLGVAGIAGAAATNARASWQEGAEFRDKGSNRVTRALRGAASGIGALGSGVIGGVAGGFTAGKAIATADKNQTNAVLSAMQRRNALRRAHSTWFGRTADVASNVLTGTSPVDRIDSKVEGYNNAASLVKSIFAKADVDGEWRNDNNETVKDLKERYEILQNSDGVDEETLTNARDAYKNAQEQLIGDVITGKYTKGPFAEQMQIDLKNLRGLDKSSGLDLFDGVDEKLNTKLVDDNGNTLYDDEGKVLYNVKGAVKAFKAVQFNATDRARNIKNTNKYVSRKANQQYAKKG